jgi:hypothetical protein
MTLFISKDNQQLGPYTILEAQALVANGTLQPTDWAWYDGSADWVPLQQVPGFSSTPAPAAPYIPPVTPSSTASTGHSGRPVLVWIICLFYFIFTPLGLISLAVTPHLLFPALRNVEGAEIYIQHRLDQVTDPAERDRLVKIQQRLRDTEDRISRLSDHGVLFYAIAFFSSLTAIVGAVYLFQLRRVALPLFLVAFVLALIQSILLYGGAGFFRDVHSFVFLFNLTIVFITWTLSLAILYYVWRLQKKGILD